MIARILVSTLLSEGDSHKNLLPNVNDHQRRQATGASAGYAAATPRLMRGPLESLSNVLVNKDRVSIRVNCDKTGRSRGGLIGLGDQLNAFRF